MTVTVLTGDCLDVLKTLPDQSVHCCVTSPPYWGLRDYGHAGQIGHEESPDAFSGALVAVFQEVRRVLRNDGTCWLNLGDTYATGTTAARQASTGVLAGHTAQDVRRVGTPDGLKTKDLIGIPWRVAFALQADGWYLRSDIIWSKPNPMPESVTDRPTKAHEYIFLLAKSERYYYDAAAIREPYADCTLKQFEQEYTGSGTKDYAAAGVQNPSEIKRRITDKQRGHSRRHAGFNDRWDAMTKDEQQSNGANKRSVWHVSTKPFSGAHFATFPPDLIEPCIKAGCPVGGVVLDPFGGAGTTGLVADRLQRDAILIELNPEYADMARARIVNDSPLFASVQ